MKKMTKFWAFALSGLMFAACSNNDEIIPDPNKGDGDGALVTLKIVDPAPTRANAPAEAGTAAESAINKLSVYIFTNDSDGELIPEGAKTFNSAGPHTIAVPGAGDGMGFLVAVNQDITLPANPTYNSVKALISSATTFTPFVLPSTTGNTLDAPTATTGYAMAGWATVDVEPSVQNPTTNVWSAPVTPVAVTVRRLVSKIEDPKEKTGGADVNIPASDLGAVFVGMNVTDVTFSFDGYTFVHGMDKTDAFSTWTDATSMVGWSKSNKSNIRALFDAVGQFTTVYAGTASGDMFINPGANVIYAYENKPEVDPAQPTLYFDKYTVYSFIIKGRLTDVNNPANVATRYWKANLIPDDAHTVLRNTIYRLTIDGINTIGHGTPQEAVEEPVPQPGTASVSVSITVAPWSVKTQNLNI